MKIEGKENNVGNIKTSAKRAIKNKQKKNERKKKRGETSKIMKSENEKHQAKEKR